MDYAIFASDMDYTLNCNGKLLDLSEPQVMGIINLTPDSFFAASRKQADEEIVARCHQILLEGGTIIDAGACSTRPGGELVSEEEEMRRVELEMKAQMQGSLQADFMEMTNEIRQRGERVSQRVEMALND